MIIVHHLNNSRSQRILWLLEELGVEYQLKKYQRDTKTQLAPPELKHIHPLGKSPVIEDDGLLIAESANIVEYLAGKYGEGKLIPESDSTAFHQYKYWIHYAEGSLMPFLLLKLIFDKIKTAPMPFFVKPVANGIVAQVMKMFLGPNLTTNMEFVNNHLAENEWFAGEFSAADIQMSFPLEASLDRVGPMGGYPQITDFVKKFQARPAYQKALEVGGPYDYA